ncbi:MAG TPA: DUF6444 domain-containing protein [Chloroflexota bacterium]|jgi:transposase
MELTDPPLPPEIWAATPGAAQAPIVDLQAHIRELEARLGRNSTDSSRPASSDPRQAPARRRPPPTGRQRGEQPGLRGACRALLPVEQVNEVLTVLPEVGRHCAQPLPETVARRGRVRRHQVVELLPLAVQVPDRRTPPKPEK